MYSQFMMHGQKNIKLLFQLYRLCSRNEYDKHVQWVVTAYTNAAFGIHCSTLKKSMKTTQGEKKKRFGCN